jgi:hypothetical protein
MSVKYFVPLWMAITVTGLIGSVANADETEAQGVNANAAAIPPQAAAAAAAQAAAQPTQKPKYPPFADVTKDAKPVPGLIPTYQKGTKLLGEITPAVLGKDLIVLISIAKGIGQEPLYGGMTWGFGDDWLWQFRKVDDRILVVRRNVRFTAKKGSPTACCSVFPSLLRVPREQT